MVGHPRYLTLLATDPRLAPRLARRNPGTVGNITGGIEAALRALCAPQSTETRRKQFIPKTTLWPSKPLKLSGGPFNRGPLNNFNLKGNPMNINSINDFRRAMRHGPYAWPGGYPVFFMMGDGEAISFAAARENRREIITAIAYQDKRGENYPLALAINWEDANLICAHSGKRIESAYAEAD